MTHPAQTPEGATTAPEKGSSVVGARGQSVPEGWKLVPIEPTDEMLKVEVETPEFVGIDSARSIYKAMLAATPDPVSPAPSVEPELGDSDMLTIAYMAGVASERKRAASPTPAQADALDALENLAMDIEAISVMHRGDPVYEHDAYWMREQAAKAVRDLAAAMRKGD